MREAGALPRWRSRISIWFLLLWKSTDLYHPPGVSALNSGGGCSAFSGGALSLMQSLGSLSGI